MSTLVHWCATFFETGARLRKERIVNDENRALVRVDVQTGLSPLSDRPRLTCNHSGMITNHHEWGQIGSSYGCLNSHAMGELHRSSRMADWFAAAHWMDLTREAVRNAAWLFACA